MLKTRLTARLHRFGLAATLAVGAQSALACNAALVLAIDVSGSIDRGEYMLQTEGVAAALSDPEVAAALVQGQTALSVVQWSGAGQQAVSLPWRRMLSDAEVRRFATAAAAMPRAYTGSDTAPGDLIDFAADQFAAVADCGRRIIDISGDGQQNAGGSTPQARNRAFQDGISINGIAIEDMGASLSITEYYRRFVITRGGFVMTARGLGDYPATLRMKILKELEKPGT